METFDITKIKKGKTKFFAVYDNGMQKEAFFCGKNVYGQPVFSIDSTRYPFSSIRYPFSENGFCLNEENRCQIFMQDCFDMKELEVELFKVANMYFTEGISEENIKKHAKTVFDICHKIISNENNTKEGHEHLKRVKELIGDSVKPCAAYNEHVNWLLKELGLKYDGKE